MIANNWEPIINSPWRIQELRETTLETFDVKSPQYGHRYDVFYNKLKSGSLEITDFLNASGKSQYSTGNPRVSANVVLDDVQLLPFEKMNEFLAALAVLLSSGIADEYTEVRRHVDATLSEAWKACRHQSSKEVRICVSFNGSATTYLKLRSRN